MSPLLIGGLVVGGLWFLTSKAKADKMDGLLRFYTPHVDPKTGKTIAPIGPNLKFITPAAKAAATSAILKADPKTMPSLAASNLVDRLAKGKISNPEQVVKDFQEAYNLTQATVAAGMPADALPLELSGYYDPDTEDALKKVFSDKSPLAEATKGVSSLVAMTEGMFHTGGKEAGGILRGTGAGPVRTFQAQWNRNTLNEPKLPVNDVLDLQTARAALAVQQWLRTVFNVGNDWWPPMTSEMFDQIKDQKLPPLKLLPFVSDAIVNQP